MTPLRSAKSRADLVRVLAAPEPAGLTAAAELLGFVPSSRRSEAVLPPSLHLAEGEVEEGDVAVEPEFLGEKLNFAPIPFLRVTKVEYEADKPVAKPQPVPQLDLDPARERGQPLTPPLVAFPRLWRVLEDDFRSHKRGQKVDAPRLVENIARGRVIRRLPRRWIPSSGRVRLVLDRSRHLVPFWSDQLGLVSELFRRLGPLELRVEMLPEAGPAALAHSEQAEDMLVVVTDLGFLIGGAEEQEIWLRAGARLRKEGAKLRALVPCPANRWHSESAQLWCAVEWERPMPSAVARGKLAESKRLAQREQLLQLIAPAVRVEPGLLRELRQLLGSAADAGTEADVWSLFPNPSSVAATPPPAASEWRRQLAQGSLSPELEHRAIEVIRRWHGVLPPLVLAEEVCSHASARAIEGKERLALREYLRAACKRIEEQGRAGAPKVAAWFDRVDARMYKAPADPELAKSMISAWRVLNAEGGPKEPPNWASPALLAALEPAGELRHFEIWQRGSEIVLSPKGQFPGGSLLGEIRSSSKHLHVQKISGLEAESFGCELGAGGNSFKLESFPNTLRLVSNLEAVELEAEPRPDWASAAGRDRYGLWADLEVGGVTQRMRYVRPGRFLMGSPETEQGRLESEGPQHMVTFTEGFWLADTQCTQIFWQAVMRSNPSRFKSPRRPVEQVSWQDVHAFLQRLNVNNVLLNARLPNEAQWEYACRAGTTTSTYTGELEILDFNHVQMLDGIAWYGGNSGNGFELEHGYASRMTYWPSNSQKAGSREVASKRCNAWGLYDMLGNVWEWCSDYWGSYEAGGSTDPGGPQLGSERVSRGGSWYNVARDIRAAFRFRNEPGFRDGRLGFRFSLGQLRSGQGAERGS